MKKLIKLYSNVNILIGGIFIAAPILFLGTAILAGKQESIAFVANPTKENEILSESPIIKEVITNPSQVTIEETIDIPNSGAVTYGNQIIIDSIGVNTKIFESYDSNGALNRGIWRIPQLGTPFSNSNPVVLAAHRWGEDNYSWDFRKQNLFLNLPDMKPGDIIRIIWNGKEYQYKVTVRDESAEATHGGDLILYTCRDFDSPIRIFVYAERI
jgi:sortase (surface protein transpeptidase)